MKENLIKKTERIKFIEELQKFIDDHPEPMSYKTLADLLNELGDSYFSVFKYRSKQGLWNKIKSCGYKLDLKFTLSLVKRVTLTKEKKKEIAKKIINEEEGF